MKQIVVLSGPIAVGKTAFSDELMRRYPCEKVSTRNYILRVKQVSDERKALQQAGAELDMETNGSWVADAVSVGMSDTSKSFLLVDSARIAGQVRALRDRFGADNVHHFHLTAPHDVLERRYRERAGVGDQVATYTEAKADVIEAEVDKLAAIADVVVQTEKSDVPSCVTFATAGRISVAATPPSYVDLFVGGQWGSEGKGNICALLAPEYDVLVRVGGPNAGHKVKMPEYTYRQLPSGTGSNPKAEICIAAGSTISLEILLKEIDDHGWLKKGGLLIDPQAMIIEERDREIEEKLLDGISSTKQGVGSAAARKILGRDGELEWGPPVRLARDVDALHSYIGNVSQRIEQALASGKKVMLEGTQGTELSIHHGSYPYVTSRETSAAGCLSDAGIPFTKLRRVIVVTRTYPIRVGGKSGPMGVEISFEDIAQRSGLPIEQIGTTELGSVSGKSRRMAEFDWERMRRSVYWNGATDIALTFVDYLGAENVAAVDFDDLNLEAKTFIVDLERICGVPVSLISKGFGRDGLIDKRNWND
ncbi:adenylosuccinate synthetase [Rhizobium sp. NTR19]|uniref:Adenylosuccinate synthetase n=1 Tax=Neorhizobium turbinariae TaxID=2937795 RepID=A0ABT0ISE1_9HYPH|nr:adenylosuccinate synthetase [Neorhizobium turbinariae]MCK8780776.1 adenylosuccinate synthetase [Neorhizobium turbinariae]